MIDNKWFCEPNDQRETWCFLSLQTENIDRQSIITGWQIGYGNPNTVNRVINADSSSANDILAGLFSEIYYCRRQGIKLVTYEENLLPILRTHAVQAALSDASLRGMHTICIENLLQTYFELGEFDPSDDGLLELCKKMVIADNGATKIGMLHQILVRIGPLLPQGVI